MRQCGGLILNLRVEFVADELSLSWFVNHFDGTRHCTRIRCVSSRPSSRLRAASRLIVCSQVIVSFSLFLASPSVGAAVGSPHAPPRLLPILLRQVAFDVSNLVNLAALDHRLAAEHPLRRRDNAFALSRQNSVAASVATPRSRNFVSRMVTTSVFPVSP